MVFLVGDQAMKVIIRSPKSEDYDRFSNIMDQVQQLHVEWRPDVYKPASPLITREAFEEIYYNLKKPHSKTVVMERKLSRITSPVDKKNFGQILTTVACILQV